MPTGRRRPAPVASVVARAQAATDGGPPSLERILFRRKPFLLLLLLLPLRSGNALRVDEQRDDQREAPDEERPVPGQPEPVVERVWEKALRRANPRDDRAGDHRDPAEIRERDQRERSQRAEAAVADRAEVVRVERSRHAGDERGDAESCELRVADVDARRRGGALVRAHGQHPLAQARAPHVCDEHGKEDRGGEDEESEHGARDLVVQPSEACVWRKVEPADLRLCDRRAREPATPAHVEEAELLECDGGRERHDHEADAPDPQSRHRDQQTDEVAARAPIRSEIGNSAQMPPTSVVRCDIVKPATPASASCTTEI